MKEMENNILYKEKCRKWVLTTLALTVLSIFMVALTVFTVDPYFRYHKPIERIGYLLYDERFQNAGILEYFDYNSIITGTCLSENFKTSVAEEMFGGSFVKTANQNGSYARTDQLLRYAYDSGHDVKLVIRSLDGTGFVSPNFDENKQKNEFTAKSDEYPYWLYDKNYLNDVNYLLDIDTLILTMKVLTEKTVLTSDFDYYSRWSDTFEYGLDNVLRNTGLTVCDGQPSEFTEAERKNIQRNIQVNVTELAEQHPETTFIIFYPPYSLRFWQQELVSGEFDQFMEAAFIVTEELLRHDNIKLFCFMDETDITCNMDYYMDALHYSPAVNDILMEQLYRGEYAVTRDNYAERLNDMREFYRDYDYESVFPEQEG